jgi:hypothetical protein
MLQHTNANIEAEEGSQLKELSRSKGHTGLDAANFSANIPFETITNLSKVCSCLGNPSRLEDQIIAICLIGICSLNLNPLLWALSKAADVENWE